MATDPDSSFLLYHNDVNDLKNILSELNIGCEWSLDTRWFQGLNESFSIRYAMNTHKLWFFYKDRKFTGDKEETIRKIGEIRSRIEKEQETESECQKCSKRGGAKSSRKNPKPQEILGDIGEFRKTRL